jgi:hypothetical protein
MRLGAAKKDAGRVWSLVNISTPGAGEAVTPETFTFSLRLDDLRQVRRREGRYLLRSNLANADPGAIWEQYLQLTRIEQAFKDLKGDLAIRPVYHQKDERIEAHIFVAFLAYCLQVTLRQRARQQCGGLTPRAILEKLSTVQMVDVALPTTDGRCIQITRYTEPAKDVALLLHQLGLELPDQPPPRIVSGGSPPKKSCTGFIHDDFAGARNPHEPLCAPNPRSFWRKISPKGQ